MTEPVRVRFTPSGREIEVATGTYLTAAATKAGEVIVHDCDGQGLCSTCRVRVIEGARNVSPVDQREEIQLGSMISRGWRLCCLLRVFGECELEVPTGGFAYPPELQRNDREKDR